MSTGDIVGWAGLVIGVLGFPAVNKVIAAFLGRVRTWWTTESYYPRLEVSWVEKRTLLRVINPDRYPIWDIVLESSFESDLPSRKLARRLQPGAAIELEVTPEDLSSGQIFLSYRCVGYDWNAPRSARWHPRRRGGDAVELDEIVPDSRIGLQARRATYMSTGLSDRARRANFRSEVRRARRERSGNA